MGNRVRRRASTRCRSTSQRRATDAQRQRSQRGEDDIASIAVLARRAGAVVTIGDEVSAPETPAAASLSPSPIAPADRDPHKASAAPVRRAAPAAKAHRHHGHRVACGIRRAAALGGPRSQLRRRRSGDRPIRFRDPSAGREGAHGLAHERRRRRRERLLVVAHDPGLARAHGPLDGVQALAAPVHLLGCMLLLQVIGQTMWTKLHAAAAVRRHDHRSTGAGGPSRRRGSRSPPSA